MIESIDTNMVALPSDKRFKNLTGKTFGKWSVLGFAGRINNTSNYSWYCRCACGRVKMVQAANLKSGGSTCCQHCKTPSRGATIHGGCHTREWNSWASMRLRCTYPKTNGYKNYGGRGITVCERWMNSFPNFLSDMGKAPSNNHSIDRIDVNGNYDPANCRWATAEEQIANRRDTRLFTINGVTKTLRKWSDELGVNRNTVDSRWFHGIRDERLFSKTRISLNPKQTK